VLYGTTWGGGATNCGCGTVFAVTPSGSETVLHRFEGGKDGAFPSAGLINVGGILYGTTYAGGGGNCPASRSFPGGCGTIFSIAP
jgi:uncharacterized repeat protein (TIGR03803 family)